MRHSILSHHVQKNILFNRDMYRKDIERTCWEKNCSDMEKNCSKSFASNSSNIEEEIIKQLNTLKPFDMEPRKAILKKPFASEEENNCEEEINLTRKIELVISIGTSVDVSVN